MDVPANESDSVVLFAGFRLFTFHPMGARNDPTMAIWLFIVLTQIQIFMSLVAAGFPALKKTVLDLVTNFGVSEDSQNRSRYGPGYILSSLTKRRRRKPEDSGSSFHPHSAGPVGESVTRAGGHTILSDDDSQKGIMRHDEYDVVVTAAESLEIEPK